MRKSTLPIFVFIGLAVLKIGFLAAFGPRFEPDSYPYMTFAGLILHDTSWWSDAGLNESWLPLTVFRPLGYPAVLAIGKLIAGDAGWLYVTCAIQIALGLAATVMVWRISVRILSSERLALLATAGYAFSIGFLYDQSIMTDSLFNSLFVLLFGLPAYGVLRGRSPDVRTVLLAAVLLMLAHSIRGITIYLAVFLLPIWCLWFLTAKVGRVRAATLLIAFLLPMLSLQGAVMAWNHKRTGQAFYVANVPVPIQPLVKAAGRGRDVFDGNTAIDKAAREHLKEYSFEEVMLLSDRLFTEYGLTAPDAAKAEMALYFRTWRNHPWALIENGFDNFHQTIAYNFFNVIDVTEESIQTTTGVHLFPGTKTMWNAMIKDGNIAGLAFIVATGVGRVGSWAMLALFAFGIPIMAYRAWRARGAIDVRCQVLLAGWILFWGYLIALVLLHFVTRFLPAVLPWGLIGSLHVAAAMATARLNHRRAA
jgi:hypothetical protein